MHVLKLKPRKDRRIRKGHPWVFSNEIAEWGPKSLEIGQLVEVRDSKNRFLAYGYCNRKSLIAVRILSRIKKETLDIHRIADRVRTSIARRTSYLDENTNAARLVNGEADHLPGLIVDLYNDVVCVQILTQGMETFRETILETLKKELQPRALVERGDNRGRVLEGLPTERKVLVGEIEGLVEIKQDGLRFLMDPVEGQKTGFFLDQRGHRKKLALYVSGRDVLDVFCFSGAGAAYALRAGARSITGIDSSRTALELAEKNIAINDLPECEWLKGDAFNALQSLAEQGKSYGCILLDPPPFAPSRKNKPDALVAHTRLHKLALRLLDPGGYLISSSCSYHIGVDDLGESAAQAAVQAGRTLQVLDAGGPGPDHPGVPGMPESRYLHTLYMQA
jgi:23S rRNA (cytosine1962-C5)-methyltransferase